MALSSVVYLQYDIRRLPDVPSEGWTRFVCTSDTHTRAFPVPDGDDLLHGGDLTRTGTLTATRRTLTWTQMRTGMAHRGPRSKQIR
jgi:hypothetical protein